MWHNETVNVWSHLLGAICFVFLILSFLGEYHDMSQDGLQAMDEFRKTSQDQNGGLTLDSFIDSKFDNLHKSMMG